MNTKLILTLMITLFATVLTTGCSDDDDIIVAYDPAPQPPQNVFTTTGDGAVYLSWTAPYEGDIKSFGIYRSRQELTGYDVIATVEAVANPNLDLVYYDSSYVDTDVTNGQTYFYAVTSIDKAGHESDLSAESVIDTPRPEGQMVLYDDAVNSAQAGFSFVNGVVVESEHVAADVYLDRDGNGVFYINSTNENVWLQAAGYHYSFDGIGWAPWAPEDGWSYNGWAEIVPGHIYIVAIQSGPNQWNYGKLRVLLEYDFAGRVSFQWAYQSDDNNPELAPPSPANTDLRSREAVSSTL